MWDLIDSKVTIAIGGTVFNIWGQVAFSIEYEEDGVIEFGVYDKPSRFDDKKLIVFKCFEYEINDVSFKTIGEIVSMIEMFLLENYS